MTDIGEIYFLPTLVERLAREAPGVTLSTVRNTAVNLRDEMEAGQVDLAIGLLPQLKAGFFQRQLFLQRYVCLLRRGHPLARRAKGMTLAESTRAEHLVAVSAGTGHGKVDELLQRAGQPVAALAGVRTVRGRRPLNEGGPGTPSASAAVTGSNMGMPLGGDAVAGLGAPGEMNRQWATSAFTRNADGATAWQRPAARRMAC